MATKKLYDIDAYQTVFEAKVLSCTEQEKSDFEDGKRYEVILDQTCFFPEEGGQTPDKGILGGAEAVDVQIKKDTIIHILTHPLAEGEMVRGKIDWRHRFFNMQQHSAEHIFSGLAYKKYGYKNVGFHLSNQIVTMDFDGTFTQEQLDEMEWEVNEAIVANVEIKTGYPSKEELAKLEYRSKIEIDDDVRIVEITDYDRCACCAPHVHRTGEIGVFKIQNVQNYKGGVRISFLCGFRALEEYRKKAKVISEISGILTTNQEQLAENVAKLKKQTQVLKAELGIAKQSIMESKIANIPADRKVVILFEHELENLVMRNTVNKLMEKHEGICGIFVGNDADGYQFIIGSRTMDCREIAAKMRKELDSRGGGSPQMIQGSLKVKKKEITNFMDGYDRV